MYIHKTLRRINVILLLDLGPHAHGLTWDQQLNLFGAERPKIKGRGSEVTEAAICLKGKYASSYRMGIQRVIWFSWSVCPSVCVCAVSYTHLTLPTILLV